MTRQLDQDEHAGDTMGLNLVGEGNDGKHIELGVTDFNQGMGTYLRMGAGRTKTHPNGVVEHVPLPGDDLALMVRGFADDNRDRTGDFPPDDGNVYTPPPPGEPEPHDHAPRIVLDPSSPGNTDDARLYGDAAARRHESRQLHLKGGWRDHTDGNRITTTRGDKVEVIRGNYKLIVLGRRSVDDVLKDLTPMYDLREVGGIDMSGGLADYGDLNGDCNFATNPDNPIRKPEGGLHPIINEGDYTRVEELLQVEYKWSRDSANRHVWTKTTRRGYKGPEGPQRLPDHPDYPPVLGDQPPTVRGRYQIVNNNYVDHQEDNLGSEVWRVSEVVSNVWAHNMTTLQDVSGKNFTLTTSGTMRNGTDVIANVTHNVVGVDMVELDVAPVVALAQFAGACNATVQVGGVASLSTVVTTDAHVGLHLDRHYLNHLDVKAGMHSDIHLASHVEVHTGAHNDDHGGEHIKFESQWHKLTNETKCKVNLLSGAVTIVAGDGTTSVIGTSVAVLGPAAIQTVAQAHHII